MNERCITPFPDILPVSLQSALPEDNRSKKDVGLDLSQSETYSKDGKILSSSDYQKFSNGISCEVIRIDKTYTNG
ncbi:MAG: hypothetical protein MJ114_04400, partial [Acetatifactor sp.]|nr:hypothetical protein [Acetatifactor sp.]